MTFIVLTDPGRRADPRLLAAAARAISRQIGLHLRPCWPVAAARVVTCAGDAEPDLIVALTASLAPDDCGRTRPTVGPTTLKVVDTPGGDEWTLDASRQIVEALVEAALPTLIRGLAPGPRRAGADGEADYPLSICAPCGAAGYEIDGVLVCDFVRPAFFTSPFAGACSFTGALGAPRTVAPGGWLAWREADNAEVRQLIHIEADRAARVRSLGACAEPHLRDFVDRRTLLLARANRPPPDETARRARAAARAETARQHG